MLADPDGAVAPLLPFWSSRQLATYAIDDTGVNDLATGFLHAGLTVVVCLVGAMVLTAGRLRVARADDPVPRLPALR